MPGKRLRCEAYKAFRVNINRSGAFLRMFDWPGGQPRSAGQPSSDEKELLRGAVVFAVGSLDSFLNDIVLEIVPLFGGDQVALRDALKEIAKDDPGLALRMNLASGDRDRTEAFAEALGGWLSQKTFQGPEAVVKALGYVGCTLTWSDFDQASAANAAERLKHYTDLRHKMVHSGAKPNLARSSAEECIRIVEAIAAEVNRDVVRFYH